MLPDLVAALARVLERVETACVASDRSTEDVRLLLATKTQPADRIRAAIEAARTLGLTTSGPQARVLIGENRVQELVAKADDLADLALEVHLIGPVQSNKINHALRALGTHAVGCVESIDSVELARRISTRAAEGPSSPMDVYVQVNVSGEASKAGVCPSAAAGLAAEVGALDGLRLRGFMTIGANTTDLAVVRAGFDRLHDVRETVRDAALPGTADAHELSMGMSRDLEVAVAAGATVVRVGTAVFGAR